MIGNYNILKKFNSGGQAETFLAETISNKKKVVIKKVSVAKAKTWKSIELFERECKILKNLKHESIPNFLDFFIDSKDDTKIFYLVQEYVDGFNLQEMINQGRRFDTNEIYQIIEQLLKIISYLHNLNPPLIHRDIKPSNIILTEDNNIIKIHLLNEFL